MGGSFILRAQFLIIGAKITTTGVLLKNAEINETTGKKRRFTFVTDTFPVGSILNTKRSSRPLLRTPSLIRYSNATVIIPLLEKPFSASSGFMIPAHSSMTTAVKRISTGRSTSFISAASIRTMTHAMYVNSNVISETKILRKNGISQIKQREIPFLTITEYPLYRIYELLNTRSSSL